MIRPKKVRFFFGMVVLFAGHTALSFRRPTFTVPTKDSVVHAFAVVQEKVQPVISTVQEKAKQVADGTNITIPFYSTAQKLAADKAPTIVVKTAINGVFDQLIPAAISASLPAVYNGSLCKEHLERLKAEVNQDSEKLEKGFYIDTEGNRIQSLPIIAKDLNTIVQQPAANANGLSRRGIMANCKFIGRDALSVKEKINNGIDAAISSFSPNTTKVDTDYSHLNAVRALHAVLFAQNGIGTIPGFNLAQPKLPQFLFHENGLVSNFMPNLVPVLKHASLYLLLSGKISLSDYAKGATTVSSAITSTISLMPGLTNVPLVGNALQSFIGKTVGVSLMVAAGNKENSVSLRAANQVVMTLLQCKHLVSALKKIVTNSGESGFVLRGINKGPDAVLAGIALYNSVNVLRDLWKEHEEVQKNKKEIVVN